MEGRPLGKHYRCNLQPNALKELARFGVENGSAWGAGHEHHEGRLATRLR
jgi:hypothetical protein